MSEYEFYQQAVCEDKPSCAWCMDLEDQLAGARADNQMLKQLVDVAVEALALYMSLPQYEVEWRLSKKLAQNIEDKALAGEE